jgi:predicted ATPase with chaperone activity
MDNRPVSTALSRAPAGLSAPLVRVEVHLGSGLPAFFMVGLPETAVRESKERVRSALLTAGFSFPPGRITVNLSPADLPKEGGRFDLPIAVGILAATDQLPRRALARREFYGELALSGELRETSKLLPALMAGTRDGRELILPAANSVAARVVAARGVQMRRQGKLNSRLTPADVARHCPLQHESRVLLGTAVARLGLSARAFYRVLKLARTCADLAHAPDIGTNHVSEAVKLRALDRVIC